MILDGTGLGKCLYGGFLMDCSIIGKLFGNEELSDFFLFSGEGPEILDALELLSS